MKIVIPNDVRKICPENKPMTYCDTTVKYLALRVTPNAAYTWTYIRNVAGKGICRKIGDASKMSKKDAIIKSIKISAEIDGNINPEYYSAAQMIDDYIAAKKRRQQDPRSTQCTIRRLKNHLPPKFMTLNISTIRRPQIQALIDEVAQKIGNRTANLLAAELRAAFSRAVKNERIFRNPAAALDLFPEFSRSRFLRQDEAATFFDALENMRTQNPDFADFVALAINTAKRPANILAMRWEWVDLTAGILYLPGSATKTRSEDVTALTSEALDVLRQRHAARNPGCPWVFPSEKSSTGHVVEVKKAWKTLVTAAGCPDLHVYDLRRTLATWMAGRGQSLHMIAGVLGQTTVGATPRYARFAVEPKRDAAEDAIQALRAAK